MKQFPLIYIYMNPSEFKVCNCCDELNYEGNKSCISCGDSDFYYEAVIIQDRVEKRYEEFKDSGIPSKSIDSIEIMV